MDTRRPAGGRRAAGPLLVAATLALFAAAPAAADTFTVSNRDDVAGVCEAGRCPSIRSALEAARDGDTIRVGAGEFQLTRGQLAVTAAVTIAGAGAGLTAIRGDRAQGVRVVQIGDSQRRPAVDIRDLSVLGGGSNCDRGGNILNYGRLHLDHVRVADGWAADGGGLANAEGGIAMVERSLLDHNRATGCDGGGRGGGIASRSDDVDALTVRDSTIAFNTAQEGGGVAVDLYEASQAGYTAVLERVTLARNGASGKSGGGLYALGAPVLVTGSIVAANAAQDVLGRAAAASAQPANCGGTAPQDGGGNLADTSDCGFAGGIADARLGSELIHAGGQTPLLALAPSSPAVDRPGAPCGRTDQRDVARPQGDTCDAGAYELSAPAIDAGPAGATSDASPTFTFSSVISATRFECRLDGPSGAGTWQSCVSPLTYPPLPAGEYAFFVRAAGATADARRAFAVTAPLPSSPVAPPAAPAQTPQPTPTPTPTPRFRKNVVVRATKGMVKVRLPGAKRYVDLDAVEQVPFGTSIDVRKGRVRLYAARDATGRRQAASFYSGVFRVVQRGSVIELQLRGPRPACSSSARTASAAAKPKKKRKARTRRLWGSGRGRFRTRGQYSAATVRGTTWLVEDRCGTTTTRVKQGVVKVRDFKRKKTILLRAGRRYVAHRAAA